MFAHAERGSHMPTHGACILSAVVAVGTSGSYLINPTDKALHELRTLIDAAWRLKGFKTPCMTSKELLSAIWGSAGNVLLNHTVDLWRQDAVVSAMTPLMVCPALGRSDAPA